MGDGADVLGETGQHMRIKGTAGPIDHHIPGLPQRERRLIHPGMYQGVKGVRHAHYLHPRRDLCPGEFVRVAAAVPPLMVVTAYIAEQRERFAAPQLRDPLQQVALPDGVGLYHLKFLAGQGAGFVEDFAGDGLRAHIVKQGQHGVEPDLLRRQGRDHGSS